MMDPRLVQIQERFREIGETILVGSGKGGVGKSIIASTMALIMGGLGAKVGLLDLDLHGASIGWLFKGLKTEESKNGLIPPQLLGVKAMSIAFLSEERALPLRGAAKSEAITELLAITNWGKLDYLIVDLPPGTGDETLTALKLIPEPKGVVVVTLPSRLSGVVVSKLMDLLRALDVNVIGIIENMAWFEQPTRRVRMFGRGVGKEIARKYGVDFLGEIPIDPALNVAVEQGAAALLRTRFARALEKIIRRKILGRSRRT